MGAEALVEGGGGNAAHAGDLGAERGGVLDDAIGHAPRPAHHRAHAPDHLAGHGRALEQGVAEELDAAWHRPRDPGRVGAGDRRRIGLRVEQHGDDVDARDAVDERVVGLGQHRPAAALEPLDQPRLPQRLGAVEPLREDAPGELAQLGLAARGGQARVAHVVADVEVGVVDPHRAALLERHLGQPLPVARDEVQARLGLPNQLLVGRRVAREHHARGDVHVRAVALEVQEGGVEPAQAVRVGHEGDCGTPPTVRVTGVTRTAPTPP